MRARPFLKVEYPLRTFTVTQRIPKEATGLKSSFYCHVDFADGPKDRAIVGVGFSVKGRNDSTLARITAQAGNAVTAIIREQLGGGSA